MLELTIIKSLGVCGLLLGNIILVILAMMLIEEYINWKGNERDE